MRSTLQHLASIANSQKSTGPKTEAGKTISSENAITHGLSSRFMVQPWEDIIEYDELYTAFEEEFPPANDAEKELLDSLAQARWLVRRAIFLQELCFDPKSPTCMDPTLGLYLRYQSTHERSFQKAYTALTKIKTEREKREQAAAREEANRQLGFVLSRQQAHTEMRKIEQHEASLRVKTATARLKEARLANLKNTPAHAAHAISHTPPAAACELDAARELTYDSTPPSSAM